MSLIVRSPAFAEGHPIPVQFTEDGEDRSPELSWSVAPKGTASFCLIVDDPDAPVEEPWVHWVAVDIPGSAAKLPAGFRETTEPADAPSGIVHGRNTWGTVGYRGPAPPPGHGTHHYHFKLYALDALLGLPEGVGKHELLEAISGHVLARGELVGTYHRD